MAKGSGDRWLMSTSSQPKMVSVIIPARDEAHSIGSLIPKIKQSLSGLPHEAMIVAHLGGGK